MDPKNPHPAARGFTLVEVMIGSSLGAFILVGVLTTFLMLGRSGINIINYSTMDHQTRRGIEDFAQDARMASDIVYNSNSSITITVPDNYTSNGNQVTYAWDTTAGSSTFHCFYRVPGANAAATNRTLYARNISSFTFLRYDRLNVAASTDLSTKRIQISMTATSSNRTVATATDTTVSACFILRNKTSS